MLSLYITPFIPEDEEILNVTRPFCDNVNLSEEQLASYRYSIVFVQYVVPFCVISYVYIQMAVKLWGTKAPGNAQNTRDKNWLKSKKKVGFLLHWLVSLTS